MTGDRNSFPVWKRAMDVGLSIPILVLISPVLLIVAAIIKLVSPGPALLKQQRIGRNGRAFSLWKFRTMCVGADSGMHVEHFNDLVRTGRPMCKLDVKKDPRIFPFGRLLRQSCIDELPQLINVLCGEMSLVGPRPSLPYEAHHFHDSEKYRFFAMPGMTGLWQVSGKNKTTFAEMARLDVQYTKTVSFFLDLKILFKTIPAIVRSRTESVA